MEPLEDLCAAHAYAVHSRDVGVAEAPPMRGTGDIRWPGELALQATHMEVVAITILIAGARFGGDGIRDIPYWHSRDKGQLRTMSGDGGGHGDAEL